MDDAPGASDEVPVGPLRLGPDAIRRLVHDLHPIPAGKAHHLDDVRRTYPQWTWDQLMGALRASGVLQRNCGHPPFRCDPCCSSCWPWAPPRWSCSHRSCWGCGHVAGAADERPSPRPGARFGWLRPR